MLNKNYTLKGANFATPIMAETPIEIYGDFCYHKSMTAHTIKKKERDERYDVCVECGDPLYIHEVDVLNMFYEVGAHCINENCKRCRLLVV